MARQDLILDRYEPVGTAGEGGFATVQIAWDPRIQRKVAIKTIRLTEQDAYRAALPGAQAVSQPSPTIDRWHGATPWNEFLEQEGLPVGSPYATQPDDPPAVPDEVHALAHLPGLDEARTAAMLADPRIVTVYDFEVRGRNAYLIMEYVEGITLTRLLAEYESRLTLDVVAAVFDAVAGALSVAHDAGVLHLDIKPDNILINAKGEVKVTDFGLATLADASGKGTTGGGTIGYMPLEQMRREHLDARTDEWSLAAVTYEMLTGENPFFAANLDEAEAAIEEAELVVPSLCWDGLDDQIDDVIFYALDPDRDARYDTVADFAEEVDKFLDDAKAGVDQISYIVSDALGMVEAEEEDVPETEAETRQPGFIDSVLSLFGVRGQSAGKALPMAGDAADPDDVPFDNAQIARRDAAPLETRDDPDENAPAAPREARERTPLRERVPSRGQAILARVFAALASAAVAFLAAANIPALDAFGPGAASVIVAIAIAVGALGALRPHVGTAISFASLGVAIIVQGSILVGVVLLVATVAWWAYAMSAGVAESNVALSMPLFGAIGGSSAVPLFAGATLRPLSALVTMAYASICALALASLGSESLLGWQAWSHWRFANVNITSNFVALVRQETTWLIIGGWLAGSVVQSFLSTRGARWLEVVGVALAVVIIACMALLRADPSIQLIVSLILGAAAVLATLL